MIHLSFHNIIGRDEENLSQPVSTVFQDIVSLGRVKLTYRFVLQKKPLLVNYVLKTNMSFEYC